MTVKLKLKAGGSMKYHSHSGRDEIWNIISGEGYSIIDGEKMNVGVGDVISIHKGQKTFFNGDFRIRSCGNSIGRKYICR